MGLQYLVRVGYRREPDALESQVHESRAIRQIRNGPPCAENVSLSANMGNPPVLGFGSTHNAVPGVAYPIYPMLWFY
jgi:hypothetical protein